MATGLLIRDFEKAYRELRYKNSGSLLFTEIEKNAYRLSLTLEVTHIDGQRYENLKTMPENSHYGYVTLFRGSTVTASIPIKYTKFRVFDIINNGIWQYHQHTENRLIESAEKASLIRKILPDGFVSSVIDDAFDWLGTQIVWAYDFLAGKWEATFGDGDVSEVDPSTGSGSGSRYRAFPVASPFPDIAKFKGDLPVSFLWRLEAWYLVNPAVYILDNPSDTGDETEGEDEYPEPEGGDGDGDGAEFPGSDPIDPNADPRDFNGGDSSIPTGGSTQIRVRYKAYTNPQSNRNTVEQPEIVVIKPGFFSSSDISTGCGGTATTGPAGTFCVFPKVLLNGEEIWSANVSVPGDWIISKQAIYFQNG